MGPLHAIRQALDGKPTEFSWLDIAGETRAELPTLGPRTFDSDQVTKLFRYFIGQGRYLAGLALLKCSVGAEKGDRTILRLLQESMAIDPQEASANSTDPVPREFLATARTHVALSILRRDRLLFAPIPAGGADFGANGWIVVTGTEPVCEQAPDGWALVWWNETQVAGRVRPAGERRLSRNKLELSVNVALLGGANPRQGATRFRAAVTDLSTSGVGLEVDNQFDRLHGINWKGRRIRLEFHSPNSPDPLPGIGVIRWTEGGTEGRDLQMGVQFIDPTPEFCQGIEELLAPGRGDVQYLWSLLDSKGK